MLTDNLTAYWKLDETGVTEDRIDSIGGLRLEVATGSVGYRAGRVGNGPDFPGVTTNGLVLSPGTGNPAVELGDIDWTISLWVYFDTLDLQYPSMTSRRQSNSYDWDIYVEQPNGITFYFDKAEGGWTTVYSSVNSPALNTWYFVVCQYDSVNDLAKIYINGTFDAQVSSSGPIVHTESYLHVGIDSINSLTPIDGCVDEMGIWKRLLSDSEITQLYNGGAGLTYPFTPPPPVDPEARNKRAAMLGIDGIYRMVLPIPDGAISAADRYQLAGKYPPAAVVAAALIFRNRTDSRFRLSPSFPC